MPCEQFCASTATPKQDGEVIKHKNCILCILTVLNEQLHETKQYQITF